MKLLPNTSLSNLPTALVELVQYMISFKAPARVLNYHLDSHQLKDQSKSAATISFAMIIVLAKHNTEPFELAENRRERDPLRIADPVVYR